jgi:hypothetical protein
VLARGMAGAVVAKHVAVGHSHAATASLHRQPMVEQLALAHRLKHVILKAVL